MIELMTREWEIARHYVLNVETKQGEINLNWEDFMILARDHRPVTAVDVSDALIPGQLFTQAYNAAAQTWGRLSRLVRHQTKEFCGTGRQKR